MNSRMTAVAAAFLLCAGVGPALSQGGVCGTAPVVRADSQPNIFSLQQELWLGEATRDLIEARTRPIRDEALNAHLQQVVDRLARNLPEPHVAFHAVLLESREVNGFSIAGGSIYITRRLAATVKSDDELAGVLGHEMGHIASHQFAFEMTAEMKRLLKVDQIGDRRDVYTKFQELEDASMKDKHPPKSKEDDAQDEADRIGVFLTAAAGYRPQALAEFWDRTFFVGGQVGNRFGDFLGLTKPGQKRLRGMVKMAASLPAGCGRSTDTTSDLQRFTKWQREVVADQKAGTIASAETPVAASPAAGGVSGVHASEIGKESKPSSETDHAAVSSVQKLESPLQMEINRVRFSPDGTLVLAQDESSIYVLTREPWAVKFRMDADQAQPAWFSPDSRKVTFATAALHTEEWSAADGKLLSAHEPVSRHECVDSKLSPDGRTVICVSLDLSVYMMGLSLLDASTGETLWENKNFFEPSYRFVFAIYGEHGENPPASVLWSSFSSDGDSLLIGPGDRKLAFDLRSRKPLKVGGGLKNDVTGPFAFIGNDKVAGVNIFNPEHSGIFSFPDGKRLSTKLFSMPDMETITNSGEDALVLTESVQIPPEKSSSTPKESKRDEASKDVAKPEQKVAIADLTASTFVFGSKSHALDAWRNYVATEAPDGSMVLIKRPSQGLTKVTLPVSPLGRLRAVAMSPDGRFLAYSTRDRGGVWDLKTSRRMGLVRAFDAAVWESDTVAYIEFPKTGTMPKQVREFDMGTLKTKVMDGVNEDTHLRYEYLTEWKQDPKKRSGTLTLHKPSAANVTWSKSFPDGFPRYTASLGGQELIFTWAANSDHAKATFKSNEKLAAQLSQLRQKDIGRLVEIVAGDTGEVKAQMVLELPPDYVGVDGLNRAGDQLYVTGLDNRTLVYSLTTGKKLWQTFGYVTALDSDTQRVCIVNRRNEAIIYNADGQEISHVRGGEAIRFASFQTSGQKLLMLLADQSVSVVSASNEKATE